MTSADFLQNARRILIHDEGLRLKPYRCTAGKLTIGVGRNLDDVGISGAEAMFLLDADIAKCIAAGESLLGKEYFNSLSENKRLAIINLIFNLGESGFAKFKLTIASMKAGDWTRAIWRLKESLWFKQVPNRANRVIKLLAEVDTYPK